MTRANTYDVTIALLSEISKLNCFAFLDSSLKDVFGERDSVTYSDTEEICKDVDMFISVGGDGTFINAAKKANLYNKPVICVNAGKLAYLACLEGDEIHLLGDIVSGKYVVEKRMMLHVSVECGEGEVTYATDCINDAVVSRSGSIRIMKLSVGCNGAPLIEYMADGAIVSTPTGSTAYSMSAGGPIIDPLCECFCITPICSHSLSAKPILLGAENSVTLKGYSKKRTEIFLTVDGRRVISLKPYSEVIIKRAEQTAQLIRLNDRSFYKTLSYKFKDQRSI